MNKVELFNDHFQNFKVYGIPHAQLIIADPPYNLGKNAYASNPAWYKGGDNKNGESELAGKEFFDTDKDFRPAEFMHFCSQMLVKEPKAGLTDEELASGEYGQIKDETVGGGVQNVKAKHRVCCCFAHSNNCIITLNWANDTDSNTISRWCSAKTFLHRC